MRPLLLAFLLLGALPASAQPADLARITAAFDAEPLVEVNLRGSLLRLAAEATRAEGPEAALMLDGLRSVTVRVYGLDEVRGDVVGHMTRFGRDFESDGWFTMVRVRADPYPDPEDDSMDGDVWVYVRDDGDLFDGLAVMAIDRDEDTAAFVVVDGTIDPAQVGALTRRFAKVDIDDDQDDD